jgi:four helix bundle protein
MKRQPIQSHTQLEAYQLAFQMAMQIFEVTRRFPADERYALTDQVRRSSRSVCANLAEAWRKRRYEHAFVAKLSDAEAEAAETQSWLEFSVKCNYLDAEGARIIYQTYDQIIGKLVSMINDPSPWLLHGPMPRPSSRIVEETTRHSIP